MNQRRSVVAVAACVLAVTLAACSQTTPGSPQASAGGTSSAQSSSPGTKSTAPSSASPGGSDPCALLPKSDAASFGLDKAEPSKLGSVPVCFFTGANSDITYLIGTLPMSIAAMGGGTSLDIGAKHKAARVTAKGQVGAAGCSVALELSDNSSILTVGRSRSGKPDETACPTVNQVVKVIDSKLP